MEVTRQTALHEGYLIVRSAVSDRHLLSRLRTRVLAWISEHDFQGAGPESSEFAALQQSVHLMPEFELLRRDPGLTDTLGHLFEGSFEGRQGDICRVQLSGDSRFVTPPHQDQYYLMRREEIWSAWIPLDNCSVDGGVLAVLPGSHRQGLLPHTAKGCLPSSGNWVAEDLSLGDVIFVHSLTVHCSMENRSGNARISVDYRYCRIGAPVTHVPGVPSIRPSPLSTPAPADLIQGAVAPVRNTLAYPKSCGAKASSKALSEIARELQVEGVVEGTIQRGRPARAGAGQSHPRID